MKGDLRRTDPTAQPGVGAVVVGTYLRALRRGRRLSGADAARIIGRRQKMLYRLETGQTPLQGEVPIQVATLLRAYGLVEQKAIDSVLALAPLPRSTQPDLCHDNRPGARDRLAAGWCVATRPRCARRSPSISGRLVGAPAREAASLSGTGTMRPTLVHHLTTRRAPAAKKQFIHDVPRVHHDQYRLRR